jgi:hypothetical protein
MRANHEEMSKLVKAHEEKLAKAKEDHVVMLKVQDDLAARDWRTATLAKDNEAALSELASLRQEKDKWVSEKESLEDSVGAQYDVGFNYALEQVKSRRTNESKKVKAKDFPASPDSSSSEKTDEDYAEFLKTYDPQESYPYDSSSGEEDESQITVESQKKMPKSLKAKSDSK